MSIFDKEMTRESLNEYLKECMETTHIIKKNDPLRIYEMAKETHEQRKVKQDIIQSLYEKTRDLVSYVTIIDDHSAIITTNEKLFGEEDKKDWHRIWISGKVSSSVTDNFDHALIMLICAKYNMLVNSDASALISRMLGVKMPE